VIAVAMPLFVFAEYADQSFTWMQQNTGTMLVLFVVALAIPCVGWIFHDARRDDRSELDDTSPRVKVVQIKDGAPITYGGPEYEQLVKEWVEKANHAKGAERRVSEAFQRAQEDVKAQRIQRDAARKERA